MSSYVKALEGVLRLFPKKVKITLIDVTSGNLIGVVKVFREELPLEFTKPTFLTLLGKRWRIMKTDQMKLLDNYAYTQKLELHVRDAEIIDPTDTRFVYPTVAASFPRINETPLFNEFHLDLSREQWRQLEFLPAGKMAEIKEEIDKIRTIRREAKDNVLLGYFKMRKRKKVDVTEISTQFDQFCNSLEIAKKGAVRFPADGPGFVADSFALETANHVYYGIAEGNQIRYLCLQQYQSADHELMQILVSNNLVMLDWCERTILTGEVAETNSDNLLPMMGDEQISPI